MLLFFICCCGSTLNFTVLSCTMTIKTILFYSILSQNHPTLLDRLHQWVGIRGSALQRFFSYLTNRSFSVSIGQHSSSSAPLSCGVPQVSILGPILFCLYMLPLGNIITKYNLSFHFNAEDSQLYVPLRSRDSLQTPS